MVRFSSFASNQIQSLVEQYCDFITKGEHGRSAFWLWYDQVKNAVRNISIRGSKRLPNGMHRYTIRYWGDVFFVYSRVRLRGKFAGTVITITDFRFDEVNFYKWLQHESLEEHKPPIPNEINTRFKPVPLGFGYTMIRSKSGLYSVADSAGKLLDDNEWFKAVLKMRKTKNGEIATFVNKDGFAYAYYPQREKHLVVTNMSWGRISTNESKRTIRLNESDLRIMIQECAKSIIYESYSKRRIGKYDVVEGDNQPHSLKGLEQYGNNLYDVRLYSEVNDKKETYAVFSIGKDTSKYICCHLETDDEYGVWLGFTPLEKQNVPALIKQDLKDNPTNR